MTTLTMKDEKRLEIIQRVFRGELAVIEAALILGVSEWHSFSLRLIRPLAEPDEGAGHQAGSQGCGPWHSRSAL